MVCEESSQRKEDTKGGEIETILHVLLEGVSVQRIDESLVRQVSVGVDWTV